MKRKLALRSGDKVTLVENKKVITLLVAKAPTKKERVLILRSPLHVFIENLGLDTIPERKVHSLPIFSNNSKLYFKDVVVTDIERKKQWYITILHSLAFWKKR